MRINTDGQDGEGHGEQARDANNATDIHITLNDAANGTILIEGTHQAQLPYQDNLDLSAKGGNGVNGRIGHDGKTGHRGQKGRNATRFSRGEDGGRGGRGESGQPGTNGTSAGEGAKITVTINDNDLALLDVLGTVNYASGIPGRKGKHGEGGRGGAGGEGGDRLVWRTHHTRRIPNPSYDRNRNCGSRYTTQSYTRKHESKGGQKGPRGPNGKTDTYPLYPGSEANPGSFSIVVSSDVSSTPIKHRERYHLKLQPVAFTAHENNGLYEPGDTVTAHYQVQNITSTMHSPRESMPIKFIPNSAIENTFEENVRGKFTPNETRDSAPLYFKIKAPDSWPEVRPYQTDLHIGAHIINTRLNRAYKGASSNNTLPVRYPVQLHTQNEFASVVGGEGQKIITGVSNISDKPLGMQHSRRLSVEVTDEIGNIIQAFQIPSIREHSERPQKMYAFFKRGDAPGIQKTFYINLNLEPVDRPKQTVLIQRRHLTVQLSPGYHKTENGFTLVINNQTPKHILDYYLALLNSIAGKDGLSIWNSSYYGPFHLYGNNSLLEDTQNGTIVMLDNSHTVGENPTLIKASDHVTAYDLVRAKEHFNISMLSIRENRHTTSEGDLQAAISQETYFKQHASLSDFFKYAFQSTKSTAEDLHHHVEIKEKHSCFGTTSHKSQYRQINQELSRIFPNRAYHAYLLDNNVNADTFTIGIRLLPFKTEYDLKNIAIPDSALTGRTAHTTDPSESILSALPFSQKLSLFCGANNNYSPYYQKTIANYIKDEILDEQNCVFQSHWHSNFKAFLFRDSYQQHFENELQKLRHLVDSLKTLPFNHEATTSTFYPLVINLIAAIQYDYNKHYSLLSASTNCLFPQIKVRVRKSAKRLNQAAIEAITGFSHFSKARVKSDLSIETDAMKQIARIDKTLRDHQYDRTSCCFFSKPGLTIQEREALLALRAHLNHESRADTITAYSPTLEKSKFTAPIYKAYLKCYKAAQVALKSASL
jgi:hypothetical protein